jgi:putative ABC transport system permease protein
MAAAMKADFPEIEQAGRLLTNPLFAGAGSNQVSTTEKPESLYEEGFTYADQEFLDILKLPMIQGDWQRALTAPNTVVLTSSKAKKYFTGDNPIGKVVYLNSDKSKPYTVSAVIEDIPTNSHLYGYDFFLSLPTIHLDEGNQTSWISTNYVTYFKVKAGTDLSKLAEKMTTKVNTYTIRQMEAEGMHTEEMSKTAKLSLQPLSAIHLHSQDIKDDYLERRGDIRFIWLFGGIAGFILLIACVNFINLSTARSISRAKEVGLRKVVGSYRSSLIAQFLSESMVYSLLSFVFGLVLAWAFLPLFNDLAGKDLALPWNSIWLLPVVGLSSLAVGLVAGLYPAIYLSSFRPAQVLSGQMVRGPKKSALRNGLVIFQFTTSIILIVGVLIIDSQMDFIMNKKIGFNKDHVMVIQGTHTLEDRINTLKEEINNIPQVKHVSVSEFLPVRMSGVKRNGNPFWKEGKVNEEAPVTGQIWKVDKDYIPTMDIRILEGRNFNTDLPGETEESAIINQSFAKSLNLSNPIGARITNGGKRIKVVIGVVEDFHFESMKQDVGGLMLVVGKSPGSIAVKMSGVNMSQTIDAITARWKTFSPEQAIRFTFLDEGFTKMYVEVQRTSSIFTCFAILAILIACLGLFGLAAFTTEQRTKEIGIRKVLGASVNGIVQLLSIDFVRLVFAAIVIACPIAWWAMSKWLEDFVYKIEIQWWMFVLAGIIAIVITLLTVSFQAVKAAITNPVKSLRMQ